MVADTGNHRLLRVSTLGSILNWTGLQAVGGMSQSGVIPFLKLMMRSSIGTDTLQSLSITASGAHATLLAGRPLVLSLEGASGLAASTLMGADPGPYQAVLTVTLPQAQALTTAWNTYDVSVEAGWPGFPVGVTLGVSVTGLATTGAGPLIGVPPWPVNIGNTVDTPDIVTLMGWRNTAPSESYYGVDTGLLTLTLSLAGQFPGGAVFPLKRPPSPFGAFLGSA